MQSSLRGVLEALFPFRGERRFDVGIDSGRSTLEHGKSSQPRTAKPSASTRTRFPSAMVDQLAPGSGGT